MDRTGTYIVDVESDTAAILQQLLHQQVHCNKYHSEKIRLKSFKSVSDQEEWISPYVTTNRNTTVYCNYLRKKVLLEGVSVV